MVFQAVLPWVPNDYFLFTTLKTEQLVFDQFWVTLMSRIRKQLVSSVAYIALLTIFFHLSGFLIIVFLVSVLFYPVKSNFPLGYVRGSISEIICKRTYQAEPTKFSGTVFHGQSAIHLSAQFNA